MAIRHALKNVADDPQQAPTIANKAIRIIRNRILSNELNHGQDFIAADWDTLIILDACRYDVFKKFADDLPGTLDRAISKGSMTTEFLRANLGGQKMTDTVYITANPQYYRLENGILDAEPVNVDFHAQINVWHGEGWDDTDHTVQPKTVTDTAIGALDTYPNKRLIIHYLQPHTPYIGPTGKEQLPAQGLDFWTKFKDDEFELSLDVVRKAYRENLELVLSEVRVLLNEATGKTVVTADHGESLGDRDWPIPIRHYGHVFGSRRKELVHVPWLVSTQGDRRQIVAEQGEGLSSGAKEEIVEKRLQDLGYVE